MNKRKKLIGSTALIVGIALIVGALTLLVWWQVSIHKAADQVDAYLSELTDLMPAPQSAMLEERADNRMPSLSVNGNDFIGILEFETVGESFPIGGDWSQNSQFPCQYYGSVYDRSLVIGASNPKGQISFAKMLMAGDRIFLTDMTGNRYTFFITDVLYRKHASNEELLSGDSDFTLFVKNVYGFEYIIIHCSAA